MPYKQKTTYQCECIKCGYKKTSTTHCNDLKCPKCGGQMRRVERPGPGRNAIARIPQSKLPRAVKDRIQAKTRRTLETIKKKGNQTLGIKGDPFIFTMQGAVEFAEDAGEEKNKLQLTLYDGSIVKHWYWGNLAFELATMKMAKKRNPILYSHDVNQRVAYSDSVSFEKKFTMEGAFLNSPIAQQIKAEMTEGFPFEASLRFDPERTNMLKVVEGQSVEVNGHTLKGPGTVMKNTLVQEGSICVFGALKDTNSEAFEILEEDEQFIEREKTMAEEQIQELTAETFASEYPDLHQQVTDTAKAEGEKTVRDLFGKFTEKFGEDPAFCIEQFKKGATLTEAIEAENAKLKGAAATAEGADKNKPPDPAEQEFNDVQTEGKTGKDDEGKPATFEEAVEQQIKADTSDKSEVSKKAAATRFCVAKYPELHVKFLEKNTKAGGR